MSAKLGWKPDDGAFEDDPDRNHVKYTAFTLYEIITRKFEFRNDYEPHESDPPMVLEIQVWEPDADVRLDSPVSEYRRMLEEWIHSRSKIEITHYTQAPDFIDWPGLPPFPLVPFVGGMSRQSAQIRQEMMERGAEFLKWQRPPSCDLPLPQGQRLLATGEVIHDGDGDPATPSIETGV